MKKTIVTLSFALFALTAATATPDPIGARPGKSYLLKAATPLGVAIIKGELDIVKKFVEYGADVNEMSNGMTPLMIAARYNRTEIIAFLLEKGANPKIKTDTGWTAFKYAELSNATDAMTMLRK